MKRIQILILLIFSTASLFADELYTTKYSRLIPLGFTVFDIPIYVGNFELEDVNGDVLELNDLLGRVIILKVWRNRDPICEYEMGQFTKYFKSENVTVLYVNDSDSFYSATNFLYWDEIEENSYFDTTGFIKNLLGSGSGPSTIILNEEGNIVATSYFYEIDWSSEIVLATF